MPLIVETWPIDKLIPYARNPRRNDEQVDRMCGAIREFGFRIPVVAKSDGTVVDGHLRLKAATKLGMTEVPVALADELTDAQVKAFRILANQSANWAEWDTELLKLELDDLQAEGFDMELVGFNEDELASLVGEGATEYDDTQNHRGVLAEKFLYPPMSTLNAREGGWKERKAAWKSLGIRSEAGRDEKLTYQITDFVEQATSIFDPVLCELMYSWFSPKGANILDPFAGGSVRGIVAGCLGRQYVGIDLREEQIAENRKQAEGLAQIAVPPVWRCGDSVNIVDMCADYKADMVFSCPPYADLERYSDDQRDLSTMDYEAFLTAYRRIIKGCYDLLNEDRFAVFVVGEARAKRGNYYNIVGDTIQAFIDVGFHYYNEMAYLTPYGSIVVRVESQFKKSRKIGKVHQNVLVFVKGDARKATEYCGDVEVMQIEPDTGEEFGD